MTCCCINMYIHVCHVYSQCCMYVLLTCIISFARTCFILEKLLVWESKKFSQFFTLPTVHYSSLVLQVVTPTQQVGALLLETPRFTAFTCLEWKSLSWNLKTPCNRQSCDYGYRYVYTRYTVPVYTVSSLYRTGIYCELTVPYRYNVHVHVCTTQLLLDIIT